MFRDGAGEGFGAWGKTLLTGFLAFSGWAVATHGATGFLLILMAIRSALFVIGILVGALQIAAVLLSTVIAPILEQPWFKKFMKGMAGGVGLLALGFFTLGWQGMKNLFQGLIYGFQIGAGQAGSSLSSSWRNLMCAIFGDEMGPEELARWYDDLRLKAINLGTAVGDYLRPKIESLAAAIDWLANALRDLQQRFPTQYNWAMKFLGGLAVAGVGLAVLGGVARVLGAIVGFRIRMTGLPTIWRLLFGGAAAGAATGAAGAAGAVGAVVATSRLARLAAFLRAGGVCRAAGAGRQFACCQRTRRMDTGDRLSRRHRRS